MKNKKYIFIVIVCLVVLGIFSYLISYKENKTRDAKKELGVESNQLHRLDSKVNPKIETKTAVKLPQNAMIDNITVTLDVLGHTYKTNIENRATVYDAMINLQNTKDSNFSFNSKDYGELGKFINAINGIEGTPEKYWIYYINNEKASLGVSKYVLKAGDNISWKQEAF